MEPRNVLGAVLVLMPPMSRTVRRVCPAPIVTIRPRPALLVYLGSLPAIVQPHVRLVPLAYLAMRVKLRLVVVVLQEHSRQVLLPLLARAVRWAATVLVGSARALHALLALSQTHPRFPVKFATLALLLQM